MERLNHSTNNYGEAVQYLKTRALQLASEGYDWSGYIGDHEIEGGLFTHFSKRGEDNRGYDMIYLFANMRGRGLLTKNFNDGNFRQPLLTVSDCDVSHILDRKKIPYQLVSGVFDSSEYQVIQYWYGSRKAKRSQVYLMEHIDQGVYIMKTLGICEDAIRAYCLHPLVQNDNDLFVHKEGVLLATNAQVLMYAMEYRNIANQYLSGRRIVNVEEIALSPIEEVNQMLIADKIHNYKDFIIHHKGKHQRSDELEQYFKNWLTRLEVIGDFEMWFETLRTLCV